MQPMPSMGCSQWPLPAPGQFSIVVLEIKILCNICYRSSLIAVSMLAMAKKPHWKLHPAVQCGCTILIIIAKISIRQTGHLIKVCPPSSLDLLQLITSVHFKGLGTLTNYATSSCGYSRKRIIYMTGVQINMMANIGSLLIIWVKCGRILLRLGIAAWIWSPVLKCLDCSFLQKPIIKWLCLAKFQKCYQCECYAYSDRFGYWASFLCYWREFLDAFVTKCGENVALKGNCWINMLRNCAFVFLLIHPDLP